MAVKEADRTAVRALLKHVHVPNVPTVLASLEEVDGVLDGFPGTHHDCVDTAYGPVTTNCGYTGYVGVVPGENGSWAARLIDLKSGHYFTLREDGSSGSTMLRAEGSSGSTMAN